MQSLPADLIEEWGLRPDGPPLPGSRARLWPVLTRTAARAVLKLTPGPTVAEHLALVRWDADGAVRLLRADPRRGALLLERVEGRTLADHWDLEACEIIAGLYPRLHRPVGAPFDRLSGVTAAAADALAALPRNAPLPRRLVEQATALARELAGDEKTDGILIHTDLHFEHVLGSEDGWVAIAPAPLSGDPAYEVAPLLWTRSAELSGDLRDGIRRRFHTTIDTAGFDEDRARAWVVVRAMTRALTAGAEELTLCIAIAKAVQE